MNDPLIRSLFDGVVSIRNGKIDWFNPAAADLLGLCHDYLPEMRLLAPDLTWMVSTDHPVRHHFWRREVDPLLQVSCKKPHLFDAYWLENGDRTGILILRDAEALHALEDRLSRTALKDEATGLLSFTGFSELAGPSVARNDSCSAFLVCHLPDLATYTNESLRTGILHDLALRVRAGLRGSDLAAHLGGEYFGILLTNLLAVDHAHEVAKRLGASLASPFECHGVIVSLQTLIAIAICGDDGRSIDNLLDKTLRALKEIDRHGKRSFEIVYVNPSMQEAVRIADEREARLKALCLLGQENVHKDLFVSRHGASVTLVYLASEEFTELEIWAAYDKAGKGEQLLRKLIDSGDGINGQIIYSLPRRFGRLANNILLSNQCRSVCCHCYIETSKISQNTNEKTAALWNGVNNSLAKLQSANVNVLLLKGVCHSDLVNDEIAIAEKFFNVYEYNIPL
jgi:GGDEF domain-containing protein